MDFVSIGSVCVVQGIAFGQVLRSDETYLGAQSVIVTFRKKSWLLAVKSETLRDSVVSESCMIRSSLIGFRLHPLFYFTRSFSLLKHQATNFTHQDHDAAPAAPLAFVGERRLGESP